jgi:hypothetical protein
MSYAFKRADTVGTTIGVSDTLAYTATTGRTSVVFSGNITNTSPNSEHLVTLKLYQNVGGVYAIQFLDVPILYGGTLLLPKYVLASQDKIYLSCDTSGVLQASFSILELY